MKKRIQTYSRRSIMSYNQQDVGEISTQANTPFRGLNSSPIPNLCPADTYTLDVPDNSRLMKLAEQNHSRLFRWLRTGLGRKYLEQQLNERYYAKA